MAKEVCLRLTGRVERAEWISHVLEESSEGSVKELLRLEKVIG